MFRTSSFGLQGARSAQLCRGIRTKRPTHPTPPSWYQKHALMYGEYNGKMTSLPQAHLCNVQEKGLWSSTMQQWVRFKVSPSALREIERKGGLDEYLVFTHDDDLGGPKSVGVVMKNVLKKTLLERRAAETGERIEEPTVSIQADAQPSIDWAALLTQITTKDVHKKIA